MLVHEKFCGERRWRVITDSGGRLQGAIAYKAEFARRHAFQIYFYGLFALGIKLPEIYKLRMTLDPEGSEFSGDYGFERYVERRRNDLLPIGRDS
jgi:hypothetical protein